MEEDNRWVSTMTKKYGTLNAQFCKYQSNEIVCQFLNAVQQQMC